MEEDDCDYRTPIGKVIKHINCLCKKPPFDNQLSEAIDVFHEKLNEQEKYLVNGIFKINFAESALFLQSCAELYGKKIDLLWNQLLEFHTRLIKYDYEHQKEKGAAINKEDIDKLEERRNRYLRKKNFKLLQEEEQPVVNTDVPPKPTERKYDSDYLIEEDGNYFEAREIYARKKSEEEDKAIQMWKDIEQETKEVLKIPYAVQKQMTKTYMLKNYPILSCEDFDILDHDDGEFNTKYSRVPSWHHIQHLIDYNDDGLLPDSKSIIANLKLAMYGERNFLLSRNIPFGTPFKHYEKEYIKYRNHFIKEESKKWQNFPLNTFEDLRKQLQFLTQLHKKSETIDRCSIKNGSQREIIDKIDILDNSDEDSLFELTLSCDTEFMKSDLFVRLEKLSGDIINTKLRQDSGIYEFYSGSDSESIQGTEEADSNIVSASSEICKDTENTNTIVTNANSTIDADINKDNESVNNTGNTNGDGTTDNSKDNSTEANENSTEATNALGTSTVDTDINSNSHLYSCINPSITADNEDNFDTRSIISDHDYCMTPVPDISSDRNCKDLIKNKDLNKTTEEIFKVPLGSARIIPKLVKDEALTKKHPAASDASNGESLPKRRKLSQKQIEILLQSKITPVKFLKFEKFFSENYQPDDGEGNILTVEYDSENDIDSIYPELPINNNDEAAHSDNDDIRSIHSEHSYCLIPPENSGNDSGFLEGLSQRSEDNNAPNKETEKANQSATQEASLETEYQRLIAMLRAQNEDPLYDEEAVAAMVREQELREKESRERVEEWRNRINPILRNLKEQEFDIHEYGSRIIEGMEINESKPFGDIVQGKSSAEVVRYFISSLQLANTNNIEICGAKQGQLSNDTYSVKLLSMERYHEHLNEYLAPSEETLAEKLARVREMTAQQKKLGMPKDRQLGLTDKTYKGKRSPQDIKKKMGIKIIKLSSGTGLPQGQSRELIQNTYQHNKENCGGVTSLIRNETLKESSTVKRQVNTQYVLNSDISLPSTSRYIQASAFDPHMPSTSSQTFSPSRHSESFEVNQRRSPNACETSPSKRRRSESTEELFLERLSVAQRLNPDIQVHSTPHGPSPSKRLKVCLKKSILF